jgi:hypothetical protein
LAQRKLARYQCLLMRTYAERRAKSTATRRWVVSPLSAGKH